MATILKDEDVVVSPRGRKVQLDDRITSALKKIKPGQGIVLDSEFGEVSKDERSATSATIKKHWKALHGDNAPVLRIDYNPNTGMPQVRIKVEKSEG